MHIKRINKLADTIEAGHPEVGFNMRTYGNRSGDYTDRSGRGCGTVACVAGWAIALFSLNGRGQAVKEQRVGSAGWKGAFFTASDLLGLDDMTASALFQPETVAWYKITPAIAAKTLRHLAKTGEVVWDV